MQQCWEVSVWSVQRATYENFLEKAQRTEQTKQGSYCGRQASLNGQLHGSDLLQGFIDFCNIR